MEDWFSIIGSGTGIFMIFNTRQTNGDMYNELYKELLATYEQLTLPNIRKSLSRNQGIYENSASEKCLIMDRIKKLVSRTSVGGTTFDFKVRLFYNSTLQQGEALDLLIADGSLTNLINHVNTTEMTNENGSDFLNEIL